MSGTTNNMDTKMDEGDEEILPDVDDTNDVESAEEVEDSSHDYDPREVVNEAIRTKDETGEWPDNLDPALLFAAQAEKSRRDTQSSYTKARQELKALEKKEKALMDKLSELSTSTVQLTKEEKEELEELKWDDPDKWKARLVEIENKQREKLEEELKKVQETADEASEFERRKVILEEFQRNHPDVEINDETVEEYVPVKYMKMLEKGEIEFEDFLKKAYSFIKADKKMTQPKEPKSRDLSSVSGGDKPSKVAVEEDIISSYKSETY